MPRACLSISKDLGARMTRHIIHVGFPKCGSTALQTWFDEQPGLSFIDVGFPADGDFSLPTPDAVAGVEDHGIHVTSSEHFAAPLPDHRHHSSLIARRTNSCHRLRSVFGEATILIVTRGYRSVLASAYKQNVRGGGFCSPRKFFRLRHGPHRTEGIEDYFDYDAVVALYERVFGTDRVVVLPYEWLCDDPEAFTAELEARLELPSSGTTPPFCNGSLTASELTWYPRFSALVAYASLPLFGRRQAALRRYRERLDQRRRLRALADLLDRAAPRWFTRRREAKVPPEVLQRCRDRSIELSRRDLYAPYREVYAGARHDTTSPDQDWRPKWRQSDSRAASRASVHVR